MRLILMMGLIAIAFNSCSKNSSTPLLEGLYTEVSPIKGGTHMKFISGSLVVLSEPRSNVADTFKYVYRSNRIMLTPNWTTQYPYEFELEMLGENLFRIPNRHASIPEAPIPYMVFNK